MTRHRVAADLRVFVAFVLHQKFSQLSCRVNFNCKHLHIPGYPPTYSDNIRPFVPGYPPSFDALP